MSEKAYLALRAGLFGFMTAVLVWSLAADGEGTWFIYLTHWTLVIEVGYLGSALALTHQAQQKGAPVVTTASDFPSAGV